MKKNWIALGMALAMALTLTACSTTDDMNNGSNTAGPESSTGQTGYTGRAGYQSEYTGVPGRSGYSNNYNNGNTTDRRTAYDYLNEGRYAANSDGNVYGADHSMAQDFTQGARDMIRGAGEAVGDVGNGVKNATQDMMKY